MCIRDRQMEPTCAGVARPEYSETVQKVVDYLEKHYSDAALSLKGLAANYLFMNPDYVSRQFLQQTGYRFVDYLLALRIRKAVSYTPLCTTSMPSVSKRRFSMRRIALTKNRP